MSKSKIQNKSQFQNPKQTLDLGFWIYFGFGSIWIWDFSKGDFE